MAITGIEITQDNIIDSADAMAVHSPLVYKAEATYTGTAPDNLKASIVERSQYNSLNFDGASASVRVNTIPSLYPTFTLCMFVNIDDTSGDLCLFSCLKLTDYTGWELRVYNSYLYFVIGTGSGTTSLSGTIAVSSGWTFVAVVYEAGGAKTLYVDGVAGATGSAAFSTPTASYFTLGARYGGISPFFNGRIDNLSFWSAALTETEILDLMTTDLSGANSDIVLAYKFDQGIVFNQVDTDAEKITDLMGLVDGIPSGYMYWDGGYESTSSTVIASYYSIPVEDISSTVRSFAFAASELIKAEMSDFDDVIPESTYVCEQQSGISKRLYIYFHDPEETFGTGVFTGATFMHAARQFGEGPCMADKYENDSETVYGCIGFYAYLYVYVPDFSGKVILKRTSPSAATGTVTYYTKPGYYKAKVLVTAEDQTFVFYRGSTALKTITVKGVGGSCGESKLLKFLDRDGQYKIYPFAKYYEEKSDPTQIGSVNKFLTSILTDQSDSSNIGYKTTRTVTLKQYIDYEELDFVESLYASPRVYYYIGDGDSDTESDWLEVTVKCSGTVHRGKNLTGSEEITVTLPKHYTQTMI